MSIQDFSPIWESWEVGEVLGKGTFGTVYKLTKEEFGKTYTSAVKHISIPMSEQQKRELYAEGIVTREDIIAYYDQVMMKLRDEIETTYTLKGNSYIVSYEDHKIVPKEDGIGYDIFIKMELLTSLSSKLAQESLTTKEVVKLGIDLCHALETLEQEKIIHRDIKPSNLFINSNGNYKLGDFGVARQLNNTISGLSIKGTYKFMAPEIFKGEDVNFTSDIYSLGLVLYTLMNNNRAPFTPNPPERISYEDSERANYLRMRGEKMPAPVNADEALSEIILKACEYKPANRWRKAKDLRRALEIYQENPDSAILRKKLPEIDVKEAESFADETTSELLNQQENKLRNKTEDKPKSKRKSKASTIILTVILSIAIVVALISGIFLVSIFSGGNDTETEFVAGETYEADADIDGVDTPPEIPVDESCEQFVYVSSNGVAATLNIYNKVNGEWIRNNDFAIPATVGVNGVTEDKTEGDGCTPEGEFDLPFFFGYETYKPADSEGSMQYIVVNDKSEWNIDSSSDDYNTLQQFGGVKSVGYKAENLGNFFNGDPTHTACLFIAHNGDGMTSGTAEKGKGSMVTICGIYGDIQPTQGAIHISETDMNYLMETLEMNRNPKIIIR